MKRVAHLLNELLARKVISDYALFGAMAQMRYTEAVATLDADVLVTLPEDDRLDLLQPIYRCCRELGFHPIGEAVQVGDWPVQFIPAFDAMTRDALRRAETVDYDGVPLRVVGANDLAAIALSVGRGKDFLRVQALLAAGAAQRSEVEKLVLTYGLAKAWQRFKDRFDDLQD